MIRVKKRRERNAHHATHKKAPPRTTQSRVVKARRAISAPIRTMNGSKQRCLRPSRRGREERSSRRYRRGRAGSRKKATRKLRCWPSDRLRAGSRSRHPPPARPRQVIVRSTSTAVAQQKEPYRASSGRTPLRRDRRPRRRRGVRQLQLRRTNIGLRRTVLRLQKCVGCLRKENTELSHRLSHTEMQLEEVERKASEHFRWFAEIFGWEFGVDVAGGDGDGDDEAEVEGETHDSSDNKEEEGELRKEEPTTVGEEVRRSPAADKNENENEKIQIKIRSRRKRPRTHAHAHVTGKILVVKNKHHGRGHGRERHESSATKEVVIPMRKTMTKTNLIVRPPRLSGSKVSFSLLSKKKQADVSPDPDPAPGASVEEPRERENEIEIEDEGEGEDEDSWFQDCVGMLDGDGLDDGVTDEEGGEEDGELDEVDGW